MKKLLVTMAVAITGVVQASALTPGAIRENARFLTDRMAYELNLTPMQYEDCYEINYDFIYAINPIMDEVVYGLPEYIDMYYNYLDYRNEDLRYILTESQYLAFMSLDYFYRPVYTYAGNWMFRVFQIYTNTRFFYYDPPRIYHSYVGGHGRHFFPHGFYGAGRYHHRVYARPRPIERLGGRHDFGPNVGPRGNHGYNHRGGRGFYDNRGSSRNHNNNGYHNRGSNNRGNQGHPNGSGNNRGNGGMNQGGNNHGNSGGGNNRGGNDNHGNGNNHGNNNHGNDHGNGGMNQGGSGNSHGNGSVNRGGSGRPNNGFNSGNSNRQSQIRPQSNNSQVRQRSNSDVNRTQSIQRSSVTRSSVSGGNTRSNVQRSSGGSHSGSNYGSGHNGNSQQNRRR